MPKAESGVQRATAQIYDTTIGWRFVNPRMKSQYGIDSMPETGENVAAEFKVSREPTRTLRVAQPEARARRRRRRGFFDGEIVRVEIRRAQGRTVTRRERR